jgi:hypothetical protein
MINKNKIEPVTYIDNVSVLSIKYGIKSILEDNILKDLQGNLIDLPLDIEEKRQELIDEYNASLYQRLRRSEYPPIEEYIDGVVKGDQDQIDEYIQKCIAIKAKYPKPIA